MLVHATQLESNGSIYPQSLVAWRERKGTPKTQRPQDHPDQELGSPNEEGQAFGSLPAMPIIHGTPNQDARERAREMRAAAYLGIPTKKPTVSHDIGLSEHSRQCF